MTTTADGLDLAKRLVSWGAPKKENARKLMREAAAFIERSCNTGQGVGEELRGFAESFHVSVNESSFYQDVTLFLDKPHSLAVRVPCGSDKAWLFKDFEERRKAALAARIPEASVEQAGTPVKSALRAYAEASKGKRCPICNSVEGCDHTVRERLLADLGVEQAGRSSAEPVAVKGLEWHEVTAARSDEDPTHEHTGDYEADTAFGPYRIEQYFGSDSYGWQVTRGLNIVADKDDPELAKAAAQDDFESSIRSCLSPSGADLGGEVERLRAALEIARQEFGVFFAFIGRDKGSDRMERTIDGLYERAIKAHDAAREALSSITPAAGKDAQ